MNEGQDGDFLRDIAGLGESGLPVADEFWKLTDAVVGHLEVKNTDFPISVVGIVSAK